VVSFMPLPLYSQGKTPGTHWIGGWVGSRARLGAVVKRKMRISVVNCEIRGVHGGEDSSPGVLDCNAV